MIVAVGIDVVLVDRFTSALARTPLLADRLFTEAEREYAAARARPAQHLAARFCVTEAVAKALGLPGWSFRDVEVVDTAGAPQVLLSGAPATAAVGVDVSISLTHTGHTAGAVAVAVPR